MFEHRLGLSLGMTIEQLRSTMTEVEFRSWKTYYKLEPWGFPDREYRTAALMMMIHNAHITKSKDAKNTNYFMRNPIEAVNQKVNIAEKRMQLLKATQEERAEMIAMAFAGLGVRAKVK